MLAMGGGGARPSGGQGGFAGGLGGFGAGGAGDGTSGVASGEADGVEGDFLDLVFAVVMASPRGAAGVRFAVPQAPF
jgi:hypothetical protein